MKFLLMLQLSCWDFGMAESDYVGVVLMQTKV